jgi:hypothetical protein
MGAVCRKAQLLFSSLGIWTIAVIFARAANVARGIFAKAPT